MSFEPVHIAVPALAQEVDEPLAWPIAELVDACDAAGIEAYRLRDAPDKLAQADRCRFHVDWSPFSVSEIQIVIANRRRHTRYAITK